MIDCTWQLMQQFPLEFQFNEFFLFTLHDHISSCQYGTFVGNSEKDRQELRYYFHSTANSIYTLIKPLNTIYAPTFFLKIFIFGAIFVIASFVVLIKFGSLDLIINFNPENNKLINVIPSTLSFFTVISVQYIFDNLKRNFIFFIN